METVDVVLSEPIDPASFDYQALSLTLGGGPNLITSGVTVTEIDPTTYSIGGLGPLTTADGDYDLTVSAGGLVDGSGHSGVGALSETWTMNTVGPTVASLPTHIQSPRNIVVPSIDVIFSEPIDPTTFTYQDITYSKEGGPNLITPSITITQLSPTEFEISNFNNLIPPIDGTYTFTVSAAGVKDLAGNTGSGSASDTWVLLTTPPAAPTDLAISPNTGATPGLTDTGAVTLTGTLSESGLTVDVMDGTTDLGFATVTGTTFSIALNLPAGANQLEVTADDATGNVSPSASFNVFVDESLLTISSVAAVTPNPRNTPVDSVDVTFSKAINPNTFTTADLSLTDNGGSNLITSAVTISLVSGSTYQISGLAGLTTAEGMYSLTVDATGISDAAGNTGTKALSISWLMDTTPPTSHVSSLPSVESSLTFPITVTGSDPSPTPGVTTSGITSFDLYVSTNGTTYSLDATLPAGSAGAGGVYTATTTFTGQNDTTYYFYAVAHDAAGNTQSIPTSAQAQTQVLVTTATTLSLGSSENPSKFGDPVTFTATVSPASGTIMPTGTVQFSIDSTASGNPVILNNGSATLTTPTLAVGSHTVTAAYTPGSGQFNPSSGTLSSSQIVNPADTTITVGSSAPTSAYGQSVSFTATVAAVTSGLPSPTGTVEFFDGMADLGSGMLSGGVATFNIAALSVGNHAITAQYFGDANFSGRTSTATAQTVNPAGTSTAVVASPSPSVYGQSVTFTATVTAVAPGAGTPTGTVTFMDGSVSLGIGTLGNTGMATYTTSALAVGAHSITAVYGGDGNYTVSTSVATPQTVNPASTTTALTVTPGSTTYGQSVTLTATIAVVSPGAGSLTGSVEFFDGSTLLGTTILSGNLATFSTMSLTAGSHQLSAQYFNDPNFSPSTSSAATVAVSMANTTTSLSSSAGSAVYSQPVIFTASVGVVSPGAGIPTGTVTFFDGNTTLGTGTLDASGQATFSTSALTIGGHSVTAVYGGDGDFTGSPSSVLAEAVTQDSSTAVVTSSADPSFLNESISFTVLVSAAAQGTAIPTGTVQFQVDGANFGSAVTLVNGNATSKPISTLKLGNHTVTASYSGDPNFTASTATALTQTVNPYSSATSVASTPNPSVFGQSVSFTATVSAVAPGSGTPTGTVTFMDGTTKLGSATLSGGKATLMATKLAVGQHAITAVFNGNATFAMSTSPPLNPNQTVNQDGTSTVVTASANPSVFGQSVTFTATVTAAAPGSGTPTGSVTFMDGTTTLGSATLSGGKAKLTTKILSVGSHAITASYGGDTNFSTSTSPPLNPNQTVNPDGTSTVVTASANPSVFGQSVTFTATVTATAPGSGTPTGPTGTVTFMDGSTTLGSATLSGGKAKLTTKILSVGSHAITASYGGDTNFSTSTTSPSLNQTVNQTVNPDGTSTVVTASANPSVFGQSVTFTATVTAAAPGSGTPTGPTGTVTFMDGTTTLGSATLSRGRARLTTSSLAVATHTITAVYSGDGNFTTSTSKAVSQTVRQDASTTRLTSSANPSVSGQSVTFTATVRAAAPGSGTPTGTVTFMDGSSTLGTATLSGTGTCTVTTSNLSVGTHAITAVYGGDSNFSAKTSAALNQVVKLAQTTTSMVSSANPSSSGQSVTFTATIGVVAPGSGTPTGIVTFLDGTTTLGTATLNGGTATLTPASLTVGTYSIKAVYGGDPNFNGSTSTVLKQVVNTSSSSPMSLSGILPVDPVDQAIASLQDDTTDDLVIQDLALEQVQSKNS